jgi:hypothetical protein
MKQPFLLFFVLLLINCSNSNNDSNNIEITQTEPLNWFFLENGDFIRFNDFSEINRNKMLPWTVQERVSDFMFFNNSIIAGVNSCGISIIRCNEDIEFEYLYNKDVYQYNTITKLYPVNNSVVCHFYFNSILNINGINKENPANTLQYFNSESEEPVSVSFKQNNPEWEIISMIPSGNNCFYLEWKLENDTNVRFRYSEIAFNTNTEKLINRDTYRSKFNFTDYRNSINDYNTVCIMDLILNTADIAGNVHFMMESSDTPFLMRYSRNVNAENEFEEIKLYKSGKTYYAYLRERNKVIAATDENVTFEYCLPELPSGYNYVEFSVLNDFMVLSWEEIDFFNVGSSGILVINTKT